MRTNIELNDVLVERGLKLTGIKTKKDLLNYALEELVRRKDQKNILKLKGKLKWSGNLNEMRKTRF